MELINYDKEKKISTVALTDEELVDLHSILGGIESTFHMQDATILGMNEQHLKELSAKLDNVLTMTSQLVGLRVRKWNEL